jgi:hypothetical protein
MQTTEDSSPGIFILSESPGTISRDTVSVTVPAATTLAPGTVLGQLSGTGAYAPYDDRESDGTENAAGVLYGELVNDGNAPIDIAAMILDWGCALRADGLVWAAGVDVDGGLADLAGIGIKAR